MPLSQAAPAYTTGRKDYPDFSIEDQHQGIICGLDEVGRGPLAGPVVAACVIILKEKRTLPFINHIRDSKKLGHKKLFMLYDEITSNFPHAIAEISPAEIDQINILQASLKAMSIAAEKTGHIDHALVDGNKAPKLPCPVTTVVKGDAKSVSIAAASIIAKVHRDRIMTKLALDHPYYGWENNVGYPSPQHLKAVKQHGITPHHRRSFAPVRQYIESNQ